MAAAQRKGLSVEDLMVFTATAAVVLSPIANPSTPYQRSSAIYIAWWLLPIPVFVTDWYRRSRLRLTRRSQTKTPDTANLEVGELDESLPPHQSATRPRVYDEHVGFLWDALGVIWIVSSLLALLRLDLEVYLFFGIIGFGILATMVLLSLFDGNAIPMFVAGAYIVVGMGFIWGLDLL